MRALLPVLVLSLAGCAEAQRPALAWQPSATTTATGWWGFSTAEFTLDTDGSRENGREAADAIQRELDALRAMMGNAAPLKVRQLRIIVLANGLDYEKYFGRATAGLTSHNSKRVTVFLYGRPTKWTSHSGVAEGVPSTLTHELAHVVLAQYFPLQPRWFAEGLAQYLEPYKWSDDGASIELGLPNMAAYQNYLQNRSQGAAEAREWSHASMAEGESGRTLYGYSWALVHYLINAQPKRFTEAMRLLAEKEPDEATRLVLEEDAADLDQKVHEYMKAGQYHPIVVPVRHPLPPVTERGLDEAEVAEVMQVLDSTGRGFRGENAAR
jgi:hypothetical protein